MYLTRHPSRRNIDRPSLGNHVLRWNGSGGALPPFPTPTKPTIFHPIQRMKPIGARPHAYSLVKGNWQWRMTSDRKSCRHLNWRRDNQLPLFRGERIVFCCVGASLSFPPLRSPFNHHASSAASALPPCTKYCASAADWNILIACAGI